MTDWDKLEVIRVVDAGYLLAGMEPERKWQLAPPIVKNFYGLIQQKTGAVTLATLPDQRMEITRSEFEELRTEINAKVDSVFERELLSSFAEVVNNGAPIDWHFWVRQMPVLTSGEAARLMCGLDPNLYRNLDSRPNRNDQTKIRKKVEMIQLLAEREGKVSATPSQWVEWADGHQIAVHDGFRFQSLSAQPPETPVQRRARWLEWFGEGERGAVQAVYERELKLNPKADRSFIGKQIKVAQQEKANAQRGGTWTSQLVQDGKRKG